MERMTAEEWAAIQTQDKAYDGRFFYGLKTTKIICRPSCPVNNYNPRNIVIFHSLEEGLASGFRPCYRCHPDDTNWCGAKECLASQAEKWLKEHYLEKFSLDAISSALAVHPNYLIRIFKEMTGKTLLHRHNQIRCQKACTLLEDTDLSISYIANQIGYQTASHFAVVFKRICGCTPKEYRDRHIAAYEHEILQMH